MRVAIWAAVSSERQAAEDKVSLPDQIERSREVIRSHGWIEAALYQVDVSRTRWVSLYNAEKSIPELHNLMESASRGEFDILVMYDFNRFRSLLRQVFDTLCDFNIQLYAITNPREPARVYDDSVKAAVGQMVDIQMLISNNQVSSFQMHYDEKMPKRITEKGLHAGTGRIPYGYRKPADHKFDRQAILEPDPVTSAHILRMKDMFYAGCSTYVIANKFNDEGISSPDNSKWTSGVVSYMLRNSFYAGVVSWGKTKTQRNRRLGVSKVIKSTPITNTGKHAPLWDEHTHTYIKSELKRRQKSHSSPKTKQLSTLVHCWCGAVLWAAYNKHYKARGDSLWACSKFTAGHVLVSNKKLLPLFINALIGRLSQASNPQEFKTVEVYSDLEKAKAEVLAKRQIWRDAFEAGKVDGEEYTERKKQLTEDANNLQRQIDQLADDHAKSLDIQNTIQSFAQSLEFWPAYIMEEDGLIVNTKLHTFISRADIQEDGSINIVLIGDT